MKEVTKDIKNYLLSVGYPNKEEIYYLDVWLWLWREKGICINCNYDKYNMLPMWWCTNEDGINYNTPNYDDPEEAIIAAIEYLIDNDLIINKISMKRSKNFKVGDIVLGDNDPYNPHNKTIPWAKGKITKIDIDAGGSYCYYLEGAYEYFWRVIPFEENTEEWYLETNNGDFDKFIYDL